MHVMVTFRHVDPTEGLRSYAEEKAQRVHKYLRHPIEAHVILSVEKQRHIAEIIVTASHLNITATEETSDLYAAIDLAMDKVERQVKKHVEKHKEHKGPGNVPVVNHTPPEESNGGAIHAQRVAVKPMSLDEAVLQLKKAKNDFLFFRNADNETLNVLYRRKDGNFGLLEPELA